MSLDLPIIGFDTDGKPIVVSEIDFTQAELEWITADPKPNEIAYINNCVLEFLEREMAKNAARLRWLQGQEEGEAK